MTHSQTLDSFRMECDLIIRGLRLWSVISAWPSNFWGLETEFNYMNNDSIKPWALKLEEPFWLVNMLMTRLLMNPDPMVRKHRSSVFRTPTASPVNIYISLVLICILDNKNTIINIALSCILWVIYWITELGAGGWEHLDL